MPSSASIFHRLRDSLAVTEGQIRALIVPNDDPLVSGFSSFLSKQERARVRRYHHQHDRQSAMVCRGLWRVGAAILLDCDPRNIRAQRDQWGRPELPGMDRLAADLNVSRTETHSALAVARGMRVGIDIETICPTLITPTLVDAVTAGSPQSTAECLNSPQAFFGLWTKKEAVLKGDGRGLEIDPREVAVPDSALPAGAWSLCGCCGDPWHTASLRCEDALAGAVAAERVPLDFEQIDWRMICVSKDLRGSCAHPRSMNP